MSVTAEGVIEVLLSLVPLALGGAPLSVLELAAASGLSRLVGPADVLAAAKEGAHLALEVAMFAAKHGAAPDTGNPCDDAGYTRQDEGQDLVVQDGTPPVVPLPEDDPARGPSGG